MVPMMTHIKDHSSFVALYTKIPKEMDKRIDISPIDLHHPPLDAFPRVQRPAADTCRGAALFSHPPYPSQSRFRLFPAPVLTFAPSSPPRPSALPKHFPTLVLASALFPPRPSAASVTFPHQALAPALFPPCHGAIRPFPTLLAASHPSSHHAAPSLALPLIMPADRGPRAVDVRQHLHATSLPTSPPTSPRPPAPTTHQSSAVLPAYAT
ncbi:hypothetical protein C8R45DRAFT_1145815 [Mycena sanguinolenta]|nr:hypothetical protein C8R45DRAFT_1145815 [Mycena sanguinolenta]